MEELKTVFAERLRKVRESRGISQEKFCLMTDMTRASLSFYENGKRLPSIDILQKITKALNISADYLIGNTDTESFNIDTKSISKILGLNDIAINELQQSVKNYARYSGYYPHAFINHILDKNVSNDFLPLLIRYLQYENYNRKFFMQTEEQNYSDNGEKVFFDKEEFNEKDIRDIYLLRIQQAIIRFKKNLDTMEKKELFEQGD